MPLNRNNFKVIPRNELEWERFMTDIEVTADDVATEAIQDDAVTSDKIAADAVTNTELATDAVQTDQIAANNVTLTKLEQLAADRLLGRENTAGDVEQLSPSQVRDMLFAAIVKLTDSTGGTTDGTLAAVSGTSDDVTINNNFADINAKLDQIIDALA